MKHSGAAHARNDQGVDFQVDDAAALALLNGVAAAVVLLRDGAIVGANPAAAEILEADTSGSIVRALEGLRGDASTAHDEGRVAIVEAVGAPVAFSTQLVLSRLDDARDLVTLREPQDGSFTGAARARPDGDDAQRVLRLQTVTALLSRALTQKQVADVVVRHAVEASGSNTGGVLYLLSADATALELIAFDGTPPELLRDLQHLEVCGRTPAALVVRSRVPLWIETAEEYEARYPELARHLRPTTKARALCVIPLFVGDQLFGVLGMGFAQEHPFSDPERTFILTLAEQCAQALDRARAYEQERRARDDAERARAAYEELLAVVAHDLKNPLGTVVFAASDLLRRAPEDASGEPVLRAARNILQASESMNRLIRDLLDAASIDAKRLSLNPRPEIDLAPIVSQALALQAPYAERRGIRLGSDVPAGSHVFADPDRVAQALANLLSNAVKFAPDGGNVCVRVEPRGKGVAVHVTDNGSSIDEAELVTLFERFRRGQHHNSETGLGLYIVKGIVEAHHGALDVHVEPGRSTTFTFTLPG